VFCVLIPPPVRTSFPVSRSAPGSPLSNLQKHLRFSSYKPDSARPIFPSSPLYSVVVVIFSLFVSVRLFYSPLYCHFLWKPNSGASVPRPRLFFPFPACFRTPIKKIVRVIARNVISKVSTPDGEKALRHCVFRSPGRP